MSDEPDAPRKFYQLKPKDFDRVNTPMSTAPIDGSATDVRDHFRAANAGATPPKVARPVLMNDVQTLLRDNLTHADASGLNVLAPKPKRRSRRARDYWLVLVSFNAVGAYIAFGPYSNAVMFVYGIAGMAFVSISLTWVMWFVMDDY